MLLTNLHILTAKNNPSNIEIKDGIIKDILPTDKDTLTTINNNSIIFENAIAFPGLINSHDHLEFNLFPKLGNKAYKDYIEWGEDIHKQNKDVIDKIMRIPYALRVKWGLYKNLICGVTTVVHHGNGAIFKFNGLPDVHSNYYYLHSTKLEKKWKLKLFFLSKGYPYLIHTGEGTNQESFDEIEELLKWNIFNKKIIGIHGISMNEKQSSKFKAVVWCPYSNLFLYNKTPNIPAIKIQTSILFGTDSTVSADWNIWNHLRMARGLNYLDDIQLFKSVTEEPANIWKLNSKGTIGKNKAADIIIARKKTSNEFDDFYSYNPEDILIILKQGHIVLFDEQLENKFALTNKDKYDKIKVNTSVKYIVKGIKDLVTSIKYYLPDHEFPFTLE